MDIRKKTCLIIRRNNHYLVGANQMVGGLNWSRNRYDAWRTRDAEKARAIAKMCGGVLVLFNPIVGEARLL